MVENIYGIIKILSSFLFITLFEMVLFFILIKWATSIALVDLYKSFSRVCAEALVFVGIIFAIILFFMYKGGVQHTLVALVFFEQVYALVLFLAFMLTSSIRYDAFAQEKYTYAFFALMSLFIFLLWGMSVFHHIL